MTASTKTAKITVADVEATAAAVPAVPPKSLAFFDDLAEDAGNWGGAPWLDGNVSAGQSASAMSQTLVKRGLVKIGHGEGGDGQVAAFAEFTPLGIQFAAVRGIDLSWDLPKDSAELAKAVKATVAKVVTAKAKAEQLTAVEVDGVKVAESRKIDAPAPKAEAKPKAGKVAPVATNPTIALPAGYVVRWPHSSYDLAKAEKGTDGAAWLVICNSHGTTTEVANAKAGDAAGRKAERATWCKGCKADAKAAK